MYQERLHHLSCYPWLIFAVTALGTFMATLDSSIVNVALPEIGDKLNASVPTVQWVVSAYLLTISSLLPLFGRLGDMHGRRVVYTIGFGVFTLGSLLCGISANVWMLVSARVIQAVGAAMLMANAPAIVASSFPSGKRGRALGMTGMIVALGSMTGPSIGGFLVDSLGWTSIFYVNLPIGIVGIWAGYAVLPRLSGDKTGGMDVPGAILFAVGMTGLLMVLSHGQEWGWTSPMVKTAGGVALISLPLFILHERRADYPMINLALFRHWPFLAGNLSGLLAFMSMFCNTMILPFYLHTVLGYTPAQIGMAMTAFPLVMAIAAPYSGHLSDRWGPVLLTTGGLSMMCLGLAYQTLLGAQTSLLQVAFGQAIIGLGNGMFQSPNNNSVLSSVPPDCLGVASGLNALVRNVGMLSGIAISVSVFENRHFYALAGILLPTPEQEITAFLYAYHWSLWIGAAFAFMGVLVSLNRRGYATITDS